MKDAIITVELETVIRFWQDAYKKSSETKIVQIDHYIDPFKGVVVFRIWTKDE